MTDPAIERVLKIFELNEKQRTAVLERGRDIVVTAGAGSGKTTTLVARYACLMAEGVPPRRMAAITYTRQAAREMRSRVRESLVKLQQAAETEEERQKWIDYSAQMDSARIGTIHSLCSEILKAHPAEAGVDPRFQVVDENVAAALRIQAVEDSIKGLVEDEKFLPLLEMISTNDLSKMLQDLLNRRLEAGDLFERTGETRVRIAKQFREQMDDPQLRGLINGLRGYSESELIQAAESGLFDDVKEILKLWDTAETALAKNDPITCAVSIYQARFFMKNRSPVKMNETIKAILTSLRENLDSMLNQLGWEKALETLTSPDIETLSDSLLPLVQAAFNNVSQTYMELVERRQALDFDDLEDGALKLLLREEIRACWQGELDAVLVDEFQDTNQRQREIAEALAGERGHLFIVGDMRQSIYRFRHADVTVFRQVQDQVCSKGGLLVDLDMTYRAHEPLLQATGDLLSKVIGTQEDPNCSYYVPYTSMVAHKKIPPADILTPHVEFVLGVGENAETGRALTARALAQRLLQLKEEKQIKIWDEVALLFRASTGFPPYEEALEEAGIPFVTVAGRGFYDRAEIRDVLNILRAVSDPLDDLSFAGLLRSPAFGLTDAALFLLHQTGQPFWTALQGDLQFLDERDQQRSLRTRQILSDILPRVDRVPVAELLKQILDVVDYRAILATADMKTGEKAASAAGGRLWRNLDKLLDDALVSPQTTVRDFLDLVTTMNDAGTREGEAPAEALGSVRLMTIHKAKGLEFPMVVLADASRDIRSNSANVYLSNEVGVTIKLDPPSILYNMAKYLDDDQDGMERLRVLYVAMTRAKMKLLVSGHVTQGAKGQLNMRGWTEELVIAAGIKPKEFMDNLGQPFEIRSISNQPMRVWCLFENLPARAADRVELDLEKISKSDLPPLYQPIVEQNSVGNDPQAEDAIKSPSWIFTRTQPDVPIKGNLLGKMVHKAIQCWLFPEDPRLVILMETAAYNAGLVSEEQRTKAIRRAFELLERLRSQPIWEKMNTAQERHHELPYLYQADGRVENRFIDLLYRGESGWQIVDFKTDPIFSDSQKAELVQKYTSQCQRYRSAAKKLLGIDARVSICFLDDRGRVALVEI